MKISYDCIVIGAGPAGLTAAIYLKRANINCLIIEKDVPGGQINKTTVIENYPGFDAISGPELAAKFYNQVKELNIPYKYGEVTEIVSKKKYKIVKLGNEKLKTKNIILAVGKKPKMFDDEEAKSLVGKGISFCALCDGNLYKNEDVAIVGGGNSALEEALYLSEICKSVNIIHRRNEMRGDAILVDRIMNKKNINILYNSEIKKFNSLNEKLESLDILTNEKATNLKVKGCFVFIGYEPATKFLESLGILDKGGFIVTNEKKETNIEGIFAAGDIVRKEAYQVITAASDGALAAVSCIKRLG